MRKSCRLKLWALFSILILQLTFAGCGRSSDRTASYVNQNTKAGTKNVQNSEGKGINDTSTALDKSQTSSETDKKKEEVIKDNNKIIKNGSMDIETKEFNKAVSMIMDKAGSCGGYVESSNITGSRISNNGLIQNRSAHLKLRIPEKYFSEFMNEIGRIGNIIQSSTSSENVTFQYYDTEAHLKALKVEEERLLELLKKTGELKDIIEIEKELTNVRYQIENLTGTLKKLDNLVAFSTLEVNIFEVQELQLSKKPPVSLWEKFTSGITASIKFIITFFRWVIIFIAYALPFIIAAGIIYWIYRYIEKKRGKK